MSRQIKLTLTDGDYEQLQNIKNELNVTSDAVIAKKFMLDGLKKYSKKSIEKAVV